jgi:hypothetical protein
MFSYQWSQPIEQGTDAISGYIAAKRELAERLGTSLGATRSSSYRLMALVGPSYPIGAAVDPENTADIITEKCVIPLAKLPKAPTPWTDLPIAKASRRIDLNASAPLPLKKALKGAIDAGARLDLVTGTEFGLSELSQILIPQDVFEQAVKEPSCDKSLGDRLALLVRGVISGKEVFASMRKVTAGTGVKVWKNNLFDARYDDSGAFELRDAVVKPKFYVVTLRLPPTRGEPVEFRRPSDNIADKAAAASMEAR